MVWVLMNFSPGVFLSVLVTLKVQKRYHLKKNGKDYESRNGDKIAQGMNYISTVGYDCLNRSCASHTHFYKTNTFCVVFVSTVFCCVVGLFRFKMDDGIKGCSL